MFNCLLEIIMFATKSHRRPNNVFTVAVIELFFRELFEIILKMQRRTRSGINERGPGRRHIPSQGASSRIDNPLCVVARIRRPQFRRGV